MGFRDYLRWVLGWWAVRAVPPGGRVAATVTLAPRVAAAVAVAPRVAATATLSGGTE